MIKAKQEKHDQFLDRLCKGSWATAFFFDFRNYVQHKALGIGHYKRRVRDLSVELTITCDAPTLVREFRGWKRSGLTADKGTLQLVPLLAEFHVHMVRDYGKHVARTFFPEVDAAAKFYADLTQEARGNSQTCRMIFSETDPAVPRREAGTNRYEIKVVFVPNDLYAEIGLAPAKWV
jgi:hypothetical protein